MSNTIKTFVVVVSKEYVAFKSSQQFTLPTSVTTEDEAVNYLTERGYTEFELYCTTTERLGRYGTRQPKVRKLED